MATPSGTDEDSFSTRRSALDTEDDFSYTVQTRKRSREVLDESLDDNMWDSVDDGRPKTRRVNPQRLAVRLGPDLVAEMEAHIVPGAKMPTFLIRKDLQERYAVDRRHIYDYFHSRGLRVAKEDKHTNLIRGRAMKAQAMAQVQSQTAAKLSLTSMKRESSPCETLSTRSFLLNPALVPRPCGRPVKRLTKTQDKKPSPIRRYATLPSWRTKQQLASDLLETFSGDHSSETCVGMSSSGTDTDWESASSCPQFTLPSDSSDECAEKSTISDFLLSPNDFVAGYFHSPDPDVQKSFVDLESSASCELDFESFIAREEHRLLTEGERVELFDLINNSASLAHADENASLRVYSHHTTRPIHRQLNRLGIHADRPATTSDAPDCHDFQKWLFDDNELFGSTLGVHDYGLEGPYGLNDMSSGYAVGLPKSHGEYCQPLSASQAQNRISSLRPSSPIERAKNLGEHGHGNLENMKPGVAITPVT